MGLKNVNKKKRMKAKREREPLHSGNERCKQIVGIVHSDIEASKTDNGWYVPCIHCGRKLFVDNDGETFATVEHIVPRCQGGTNDLSNTALACETCNNEKSLTHDNSSSERSREIRARLLFRRASRMTRV